MRNLLCKLVLCLALVAAGGCGDDCDDCGTPPTATRTAPAAPTATQPLQPTATAPPSATATAVPSSTPTATVPTVTATPSVTATGTPSLVEELAATGIGRYVGTVSPVASEPVSPNWDTYRYQPLGSGDPQPSQPICLRGGQYQVLVHRGTSNRVMLYLEGGGACWNQQTCWVTPTAKLTADAVLIGASGILEFDNADNPFRDWSVVYAPYCDGSVFSGDNVVDYGGNRTFHHGLQNLSAAVALMREQFPDPELIVVAGSSAGGYGTFTGYGLTRVAYPDASVLVLNDSGPGLQNNGREDDVQERLENWNYGQFLPPSCTRCSEQITYLTEWALERDPTLRVGYFSFLQDPVISFFTVLDLASYEALLREVTGDLHSRQPERFQRFFLQGEAHTILFSPLFYEAEIAGVSLRDWTDDLIDGGPAWQDLIEPATP